MKKLENFKNAEILHASYDSIVASAGDVIYCDPPYLGTQKYDALVDK